MTSITDPIDSSKNYIIHSENLAALKALCPDLQGKVSCIYIDPPYNAFMLNDPVNDKDRQHRWYDDSMDPTDWVAMMTDRITLMHAMLEEQGTFWVSINDCEIANLQLICDKIFSKENRLMTVIWEKGGVLDDLTPYIAESHDYLLAYAKNKASCEQFIRTNLKQLGCGTIWSAKEVGDTFDALNEVAAFNEKVFPTPKPEGLIHRILSIATKPNDLILDCFGGSGTSGAVAHKMGRRWVMIEQGIQCLTHIIPRMKSVIQGKDQGGVSKLIGWQGGGTFEFLDLTILHAGSFLNFESHQGGPDLSHRSSPILRQYEPPRDNSNLDHPEASKIQESTRVQYTFPAVE